jgi:hypothetical protein
MEDRETVSKPNSRTSNKYKMSISKIVVAIVLIGAIGVATFSTLKYQDAKKNPQSLIQADQKKLIDKVGALIELPKDEQPSIATVSDKEKLKEQAFFKSAENGDTLLIYTKAKKAILYREKTNKVVEVAPIAIDAAAGSTPQTK